MKRSNITDMMAQANTLLAEAKSLVLNEAATAEDLEQAERLREEALSLKARASKLQELTLMEEQALPVTAEPAPEREGDFSSWEQFVKAIRDEHVTKGNVRDPRLVYLADDPIGRSSKDMSGTSGGSGGFLVPMQQLTQIMSVAAPLSIVRSRATVIRMTGRQLEFPILDQQTGVAGGASFYGGLRAYWADDNEEAGISEPQFRRGTLNARKLIVYSRVPNELLEDANALADFLGGPLGLPGVIAWEEDHSFLRGNGVGKPLGILNAPATKSVTRTTASTVKYEDLANMEAAFLGQSPVWIATLAAKSTLMLMNGPTGNPSYLWGNAESGAPSTLLGHPILFTDKLPAVGARGDIVLADMRYYLIGDPRQTAVEASTEERFRYAQTSFRAVHRVDGQPWLPAPVLLSDGSTTVSPFVVIAA